jgi:UDP-N-acetylmuramoyl-tripeptide--D-alanyl-D-alanine ligase
VTAPVFPLSAAAIAEAVTGHVIAGDRGRRFTSFSIDSRTVQVGDLFVAIAGPRYDGHAFVADAVARGAAGAMVSRADLPGGPPAVPTVLVGDTVVALQTLAGHVRRVSGARVVAVTGSTGKTTTKEAAATFLEARYRTLRNRGNLNNHIGLPLSLLELQGGAEVAVVELGMNHAGEIRKLVEIAQPDVRVWTNVGTAHIGHFGSMDSIAEAKAEILEMATASTVFVANADDPRVMARVPGFVGHVITFSTDGARADVEAFEIDDHGLDGTTARVRTPAGELRLDTRLPGRGNLANVLAGVAVGITLGVSLDEIASRSPTLRPAPRRGEVLRLARDVVVLDDCYNSSPSAVGCVLELVSGDRSGRRRVAFLGEMLELGEASETLHRQTGERVARAGIAALVTVGSNAARALGAGAVAAGLDASNVRHVETSDQAASLVPSVVQPGDLVLVKGSRGVRMERVVEQLQAELT